MVRCGGESVNGLTATVHGPCTRTIAGMTKTTGKRGASRGKAPAGAGKGGDAAEKSRGAAKARGKGPDAPRGPSRKPAAQPGWMPRSEGRRVGKEWRSRGRASRRRRKDSNV